MAQYVATGAVIIGLPVFLFKQSKSHVSDDSTSDGYDVSKEDKKSRRQRNISFMPICKEGLLPRAFVTGISVAGVFSLFYLKYPQINEETMSESEKGAIMGIRFLSSLIIQNWKWKMFEMTMSGKDFFIRNNIRHSWQAILSSIIEPSRLSFNNNSDSNKYNEESSANANIKKVSTRKDAFLHLLELLGYGGLLFLIQNKIINNPEINVKELGLASKYLLMMSLSLPVVITNNILSVLTGIILGDRVNVRYCYDKPFLSLNLRDFWKRWSIQIGEPLMNYFYFPMGGKKHAIFASFIAFGINGLDHIWYGGMLEGKGNYPWYSQGSAFGVLWIGTSIDSLLHSYLFSKKQKEKQKQKSDGTSFTSIAVKMARYVLLWATLVGQTVCLSDSLLPMIQGKE